MKKLLFLVAGLVGLSTFGAELTNRGFVTNEVNTVVVREVKSVQDQIIEKITAPNGTVTNAAAVAVAKDYTDAKAAEGLAAAQAALEEATTGLNAKIDAAVAGADAATSNINVKVNAAVETLTTKIDTDVSALDASLKAKIESDVAASAETINAVIVAGDTSVSNAAIAKIEAEKTALTNKINSDITDATNAVATKASADIASLGTTLTDKIDTDVGNLSTTLNTKIDTNVETLTTKINTDVGALSDTVDSKVAELTTKINTDVGNLETTLTTKINTDVAGAATVAHEELTNFVAQLNAKIGECTASDPAAAKSYVDGLVASIPKFKVVVVDAVPAVGDAENATVYLVRNDEQSGAQLYSEWIRVNTGTEAEPSYSMEKLGEAAISLDGYATESYVDGKIDTVNETITSLSGTVASNKTELEGKITVADGKGAQGIADAASALTYAQGVNAAVETLTGTVEANRAALADDIATNKSDIASLGTQLTAGLAEAKTYADEKASAAEASANTYTDGKVVASTNGVMEAVTSAIATAKSEANTYADGKASAAETAAKDYADEKDVAVTNVIVGIIGSEVAGAKTYADGKKDEAVDAAVAADTVLSNNLNTVIGTIRTALEASIAAADGKAVAAQEFAEAASNNVLVASRAYTDEKATATLSAAETLANNAASAVAAVKADKTYVDEQDISITNALYGLLAAYTDTKVGTLTEADVASEITAKVGALDTSLKAYADNAGSEALSTATERIESATNEVAATASADATAKASAAEAAAKLYADGKLTEAETFTTNAIATKVGDLGQSATVVAYVDASVATASAAASAADGKAANALAAAATAQETADAAELAATTADGKAVAAAGTADAAAAKLVGIDTTVTAYVTSATSTAKTEAVAEATAASKTYTDGATNELGTVVAGLATTVASKADDTRVDVVEQTAIYNWGDNASVVTNIEGTAYTMYTLENRVNVDAELTSPYLALRLPDAVDASYAKQRGIQVVITTGADKPSIAILHDENTKVFKGNALFVSLESMEANKTYLIYFQEIGRNKWWYQTEQLTEL